MTFVHGQPGRSCVEQELGLRTTEEIGAPGHPADEPGRPLVHARALAALALGVEPASRGQNAYAGVLHLANGGFLDLDAERLPAPLFARDALQPPRAAHSPDHS